MHHEILFYNILQAGNQTSIAKSTYETNSRLVFQYRFIRHTSENGFVSIQPNQPPFPCHVLTGSKNLDHTNLSSDSLICPHLQCQDYLWHRENWLVQITRLIITRNVSNLNPSIFSLSCQLQILLFCEDATTTQMMLLL